MASSLKEVEEDAKAKHTSIFDILGDLKDQLRNMMTKHKLWEDKIIKSSDSEETKERERRKVSELVGKVGKSETEFESFREMFQQVFSQRKKLTLCLKCLPKAFWYF